MLKDLILEMCVPSLRWSEAHRMHRNIPNYSSASNISPVSSDWFLTFFYTHTPTSPSCGDRSALGKLWLEWKGRTWIPSSTVCTSVIAWHGLDQFLKGSLVARLVTLAQCGGHVVHIWCMRFNQGGREEAFRVRIARRQQYKNFAQSARERIEKE